MAFEMPTWTRRIKKRKGELATFILAFPLGDKRDTSVQEQFNSKTGMKTHLVPPSQGGERGREDVFKRFSFGDIISSLGNNDLKI